MEHDRLVTLTTHKINDFLGDGEIHQDCGPPVLELEEDGWAQHAGGCWSLQPPQQGPAGEPRLGVGELHEV